MGRAEEAYHIPAGEVVTYALATAVISDSEVTGRVRGGGIVSLRFSPEAIQSARRDKVAQTGLAGVIAASKASDSWGADAQNHSVEYWIAQHGATAEDFRRLFGEIDGVRGDLWDYHDRNRNKRAARLSAESKRKKARAS